MSAFYSYFHTRNDTGAVFYVGKGKGSRAHSRDNRNQHWHNIAKKHGYAVHTAMSHLSEADAFEHEKFLIACFKDMGVDLVNQTDGGDGPSGYKATAESRAKNSARGVEQMRDQELRVHLRTLAVERCESTEFIAKLSTKQTEAWANPEHKAKMKAAALQRWANSAERAKQSDRTRAYFQNDAARENMRLKSSGKTLSDVAKAKISAVHKGKPKSEETRARMKAAWVIRRQKLNPGS